MDEFLTMERLGEILRAARGLKIGVVGDFSLQVDWITERAGNDTPRRLEHERYSCDGAARTALKLAALGVSRVQAFTALGQDPYGERLRQELRKGGVDDQAILEDASWVTPFRGRRISANGDQQPEDSGAAPDHVNQFDLAHQQELLARLEASLPELDAVVVMDNAPEDLAEGVITPGVVEGLNRLAGESGRTIFTVASRERIGQFQGMLRTPNRLEAARWLFPGRDAAEVGLEAFAEAALYPQVDCGCPLFITLGAQGCLVVDGGESHLVPALTLPPALTGAPHIHLPGAGETFLAAITIGMAAGALPVEAARLGHLAAAVILRRQDENATATPEEIRLAAEQA